MEHKLYFLDALRVVLILLIVLLHVMQIYNPNHTWLFYNGESIRIIPYLIDFLLLFTLTAFFIMSGFLGINTVKKVGVKLFIEKRFKRIFIPIIITALTVNSIQTYLLVENGWMEFNLISYIEKGGWVSHLWFLIDLCVFFLILAIASSLPYFLRRKISFLIEKLFNNSNIYIFLLLMAVFTVVLMAIASTISKYWNISGIIDLNTIALYFPFFILGIILYLNQEIRQSFLEINSVYAIFIIITTLYLSNYLSGFDHKLLKLSYYFFNVSSKFFASALCFHLFYIFTNKPIAVFSFLSDSAYSIYLFHHLLVVAIGLVLINSELDKVTSFVILLTSVIVTSIFIHKFLISKNNLLSLLFNGKRK